VTARRHEARGGRGAPDRPWRAALLLHAGLLAGLAVYIASILVSGGYHARILGLGIPATAVEPPLIAFLVLLVSGLELRRRRLGLGAAASHDAVALFCASMLVYLIAQAPPSGDTLATRYLPMSILRDGSFDLDKLAFLYRDAVPYSIEQVRGHYVAVFPVAAALLALPVYLPSALGGVDPASPFLFALERLAGASLIALSAAILLLALRRLTTRGLAFVISLAYAFGSASLSTSSQGLWGHTAGQFAIAVGLYALVRAREEPRWVAPAGFALSFAIISRPTNALLAVALAAYVLLRHRRQVVGFALAGLPPILFQLWYNAIYFGDPWRTQYKLLDPFHWSTPTGFGLAATLLSPGRGLFVYSPIFLLSFLGGAIAWGRGGDALVRALGVGVVATIFLYARWVVWWGGHSYGPRLLADISAPLAVMLCPLRDRLASPGLRGAFIAFLTWSVLAHAAGVFWQDGRWNGWPNVDRSPSRVWSWTDNPLTNSLTDVSGRAAALVGLLPTSRTSPGLVVPAYRIESLAALPARPREMLPLSVTVANEGKALWLSRSDRGEIALEWRLIAPDSRQVLSAGRVPLRYDVFPRGHHDFSFAAEAPDTPGTYRLELGLSSLGGGRDEWIVSPAPPSTLVTVTTR
jgi:hypothetical protein